MQENQYFNHSNSIKDNSENKFQYINQNSLNNFIIKNPYETNKNLNSFKNEKENINNISNTFSNQTELDAFSQRQFYIDNYQQNIKNNSISSKHNKRKYEKSDYTTNKTNFNSQFNEDKNLEENHKNNLEARSTINSINSLNRNINEDLNTKNIKQTNNDNNYMNSNDESQFIGLNNNYKNDYCGDNQRSNRAKIKTNSNNILPITSKIDQRNNYIEINQNIKNKEFQLNVENENLSIPGSVKNTNRLINEKISSQNSFSNRQSKSVKTYVDNYQQSQDINCNNSNFFNNPSSTTNSINFVRTSKDQNPMDQSNHSSLSKIKQNQNSAKSFHSNPGVNLSNFNSPSYNSFKRKDSNQSNQNFNYPKYKKENSITRKSDNRENQKEKRENSISCDQNEKFEIDKTNKNNFNTINPDCYLNIDPKNNYFSDNSIQLINNNHSNKNYSKINNHDQSNNKERFRFDADLYKELPTNLKGKKPNHSESNQNNIKEQNTSNSSHGLKNINNKIHQRNNHFETNEKPKKIPNCDNSNNNINKRLNTPISESRTNKYGAIISNSNFDRTISPLPKNSYNINNIYEINNGNIPPSTRRSAKFLK